MHKPLKILLGKPGLDGHDRGIKVIAHGLRDAGFEIVYLGLHRTPEQIATAAVEEDVDLIGLSCLSGAHLHVCAEVVHELRARGAGTIPVIAGGIVPAQDVAPLQAAGIGAVFGPGATVAEIVAWVTAHIVPRVH